MWKQLCFLALFLTLVGHAEEYVIRYQKPSMGGIFFLENTRGERVGTVFRKQSEGGYTYSFVERDQQILAQGLEQRTLSDACVLLKNEKGEDLGRFCAEILSVYPTKYLVFSKQQQLVATGHMNWLGNYFCLTDPNNPKHFIVTFFRPMFKLINDHWHFEIHEKGSINLSLLSIMGAFQTACDLNLENTIKPKDQLCCR